MPQVIANIVAFCEARLVETAQRFTDELRNRYANYTAMDRAVLLQAVTTSLKTLIHAIGTGDLKPFLDHARSIGKARASSGFIAADMFGALNELRRIAWNLIEDFNREHQTVTVNHVRRLEDIIHAFDQELLTSFSVMYRDVQLQINDQAAQITAQQQTIRELSTPILPLYEGILVVPLVGVIDSFRAGQIMERLLTAIAERQSDIVIIDITGVPVIDTAVANYFLQTARAAQLIGAQVILVGIGPEIAQTLGHLGVDLSDIQVGATLQTGIELAFQRTGHEIRPLQR